MRFIIIAFVIQIVAVGGCTSDSTNAPVSDRAGGALPNDGSIHDGNTAPVALDFNDLSKRLTKLNSSEISYFQSNWPSLRSELRALLETGQIQKLSVEQQDSIFIKLDYLRSCYHPDVMRRHGDEIREIGRQLKLSDELQTFVNLSE